MSGQCWLHRLLDSTAYDIIKIPLQNTLINLMRSFKCKLRTKQIPAGRRKSFGCGWPAWSGPPSRPYFFHQMRANDRVPSRTKEQTGQTKKSMEPKNDYVIYRNGIIKLFMDLAFLCIIYLDEYPQKIVDIVDSMRWSSISHVLRCFRQHVRLRRMWYVVFLGSQTVPCIPNAS